LIHDLTLSKEDPAKLNWDIPVYDEPYFTDHISQKRTQAVIINGNRE
jgi:hypothetical protein